MSGTKWTREDMPSIQDVIGEVAILESIIGYHRAMEAVVTHLNEHHPKRAWGRELELFTVREQLKQARGERVEMTRKRDEAVARATDAEEELEALCERVDWIVPGTELIRDAWNGNGTGRLKHDRELGVQNLIRDRVWEALDAVDKVDPVEAKAAELHNAAWPDVSLCNRDRDVWETCMRLARHNLGGGR